MVWNFTRGCFFDALLIFCVVALYAFLNRKFLKWGFWMFFLKVLLFINSNITKLYLERQVDLMQRIEWWGVCVVWFFLFVFFKKLDLGSFLAFVLNQSLCCTHKVGWWGCWKSLMHIKPSQLAATLWGIFFFPPLQAQKGRKLIKCVVMNTYHSHCFQRNRSTSLPN